MLRTLRARFFADEETAIDAPIVAPPSLAMAASVVALGFLGSRLLGLVRTVAIAHQFGTSSAGRLWRRSSLVCAQSPPRWLTSAANSATWPSACMGTRS